MRCFIVMLGLAIGGCSSSAPPAAISSPKTPGDKPVAAKVCREGKVVACPCGRGKGFRKCVAGVLGKCVCRLRNVSAISTRTVRPPRAGDLAGYIKDMGLDGHLWTKIGTTHGAIRCRLFRNRAPLAVANFVGLARGLKAWRDPNNAGATSMKRFYDGLLFHRVIPNFMIQGGDPVDSGKGGPGYKFANETHPTLKFNRAGRLAMANAGPGTNGSQFFITERATSWINGRHTIFGQCEDLDVVGKIARVPRHAKGNAPKTRQQITEVTFTLGRKPN